MGTERLTTNKQANAEYRQAREKFLFKLLGAVSPVEKMDPSTERSVALIDAEIGDEPKE
jgi:hypothetical protein